MINNEFRMPAYMVGEVDDRTVLTIFNADGVPTASLRMDKTAVTKLINMLYASIIEKDLDDE